MVSQKLVCVAQTMAGERLGLQRASSESNSSQESSYDAENVITEDEVDTAFKPIPGARDPTGKREKSCDPADDDSESGSDDTEGFIVDDEDEGAVQELDLPMQFSMSRAQPLALSFKVFFQFLVHVACQPPRLREAYIDARLSGRCFISCGGSTAPNYAHRRYSHGGLLQQRHQPCSEDARFYSR